MLYQMTSDFGQSCDSWKVYMPKHTQFSSYWADLDDVKSKQIYYFEEYGFIYDKSWLMLIPKNFIYMCFSDETDLWRYKTKEGGSEPLLAKPFRWSQIEFECLFR